MFNYRPKKWQLRALSGLKRSDEQFLVMTKIVAAEAKRAGVAVHREGLKLGNVFLFFNNH